MSSDCVVRFLFLDSDLAIYRVIAAVPVVIENLLLISPLISVTYIHCFLLLSN